MSNTYERSGVTIEAHGGGYYDLKHPSLAEPERVRGKETADQRADEIGQAAAVAAAAAQDRLEQPDLEAAAQAALTAPAEPAAVPELPETDAKDAEIANLKAQLAAARAAAENAPVATVTVTSGETPPNKVPLTAPREYRGKLTEEQRKAIPLKFTRIVLEENDDIPPTGLFIQHNGKPYVIVPGEEVDVPDFLLGVLNDAVMSAPVIDSKTRKVLGYRNRSRYPYRLV